MKHLIMLIGAILSSKSFAQASPDICLLKASSCILQSKVAESEYVLSQYNGIIQEQTAYQASASYAFTYQQTSNHYFHHHQSTDESGRYSNEILYSNWVFSPTQAKKKALQACQEARTELIGSMVTCP